MKKFMSLALAMVLLISVGSFATAAERSDKQKATDFLISTGWTQSEIDDLLTDEALLVYADAISSVVSEKSYFRVNETGATKVSKKEFDAGVKLAKEVQAQNIEKMQVAAAAAKTTAITSGEEMVSLSSINTVTTTDGYMEYYVQSSDLGNHKFALAARYEWLIEPSNRDIDAFGLGHDTNLTQTNEGVYYVYKSDLDVYDTNCVYTGTTTYETYTPTSIANDPGGVAVGQDLYNTDISTYGGIVANNHRGYIQYNVIVNNPNNITLCSVSAQYKHQQGLYTVSPSISWPAGAGLSVTYSTFFKTMSPNPYLSFVV